MRKLWITAQNYYQFRDEKGVWDLPALAATLLAMTIASRFILMSQDHFAIAQTTITDLQPAIVETPLDPASFIPGDSFAGHYGRRADKEKRARAEEKRQAAEALATALAEEKRQADAMAQQLVARRRARGQSNADIAEDLGLSLSLFSARFPPPG